MTTNMGFDSQEFELELEQTASVPTESARTTKWQDRLPALGPEITFAKAGRFEIKMTNKQGKEIKKYPAEMQIIILGSKFGRQKWIKEGEKNRVSCQTVSHYMIRDAKYAEGKQEVLKEQGFSPFGDGTWRKEVEGGLWMIPGGDAVTNKLYDPVGTQTGDDGKPMSCADCMAKGLNEGCGQKGYIYAYLVGMTNDEDEMVPLQNPIVVSFKTPKASGVSYQIYVKKDLREKGYRPNQVVSRVSVEPTPNGLSNQLIFEMDDRADQKMVEEATSKLTELREQFDAEQKALSEERRRVREAKRAGAVSGKSGGEGPDFVPTGDFDF